MRFLYKIVTPKGSKIEFQVSAKNKKIGDKKIYRALLNIGEYKIVSVKIIDE